MTKISTKPLTLFPQLSRMPPLAVAVAAGALALGSAHALVVSPNDDPLGMLARADANKDGDVTWEEVLELRAQAFARLDRNGDDVVSLADKPPVMAKRFTQKFSELEVQFDANEDGQITQQEFMEAPAPAFELGDINEDGVLTKEEIELAAAKKASQVAASAEH